MNRSTGGKKAFNLFHLRCLLSGKIIFSIHVDLITTETSRSESQFMTSPQNNESLNRAVRCIRFGYEVVTNSREQVTHIRIYNPCAAFTRVHADSRRQTGYRFCGQEQDCKIRRGWQISADLPL